MYRNSDFLYTLKELLRMAATRFSIHTCKFAVLKLYIWLSYNVTKVWTISTQ